jgi:hypothetical protein
MIQSVEAILMKSQEMEKADTESKACQTGEEKDSSNTVDAEEEKEEL